MRANIGRTTVPMSGKLATRLSAGGQPQPVVHRPQAAVTTDVPRSGSRELVRLDSAGLIAAGKVTGSPPEPIQAPLPVSAPPRDVYPGQHD